MHLSPQVLGDKIRKELMKSKAEPRFTGAFLNSLCKNDRSIKDKLEPAIPVGGLKRIKCFIQIT